MIWHTRVFGFVEHYRYGEPISGAQMHLGAAWSMVRKARGSSPAQLGYGRQSLTIFVDDVGAHFRPVSGENVKIVQDL